MSLSERASDDELAEPEGSPRWPAASTRPTGSHHAYPAPYPPPWGEDEGHDAATDADAHVDADIEAAPASGTGPSNAVIAVCLGVGVSLFALGVALMTIVI